jgi:hypothetical protein
MPKLKCDGIFGPRTEERVKQHQSSKRLNPDGVVGPATMNSLFETVTFSCTAKFRRTDAVPVGSAFSVRSIAAPNLGPPLSPELEAWARAQAAFLKWWAQPTPKPRLPTPNLGPTPGSFGPLLLPRATNIFAPPPPAQTGSIQITHQPDEGGRTTIQFGQETSVQGRKPRETVAKLGIEFILLRGRLAEFGAELSGVKNKKADGWSAEAEFTLTSNFGLPLQYQGGPFDLKLAAQLAGAFSTELTALLFLAARADAEILIIRAMDGTRVKLLLTLKGGLKGGYDIKELPNGGEVHQWQTPVFAGEASAGIGFNF